MDPDVQILAHRVGVVEETLRDAIGEIRDGILEIAANTGKLAILEERHAETRDGLGRAFDEIRRLQSSKCDTSGCRNMEDRMRKVEESIPQLLESRLLGIEVAMPALKETRKWVVGGVLSVVAVVGLAVVALVVAK